MIEGVSNMGAWSVKVHVEHRSYVLEVDVSRVNVCTVGISFVRKEETLSRQKWSIASCRGCRRSNETHNVN